MLLLAALVVVVLVLLLLVGVVPALAAPNKVCTRVRLQLGDQCTWVAFSDGAHPKPPCDWLMKPYNSCPYGRRSKGLGIPEVCKKKRGCGCSRGLVCRGPKVDVCSGGKGQCVPGLKDPEQREGEFCLRKGKQAPCASPLVCVAETATESRCRAVAP